MARRLKLRRRRRRYSRSKRFRSKRRAFKRKLVTRGALSRVLAKRSELKSASYGTTYLYDFTNTNLPLCDFFNEEISGKYFNCLLRCMEAIT